MRSTPRARLSKSSTIRKIHSTASRSAAASRLDSGPLRASRSNCTGTLAAGNPDCLRLNTILYFVRVAKNSQLKTGFVYNAVQ